MISLIEKYSQIITSGIKIYARLKLKTVEMHWIFAQFVDLVTQCTPVKIYY